MHIISYSMKELRNPKSDFFCFPKRFLPFVHASANEGRHTSHWKHFGTDPMLKGAKQELFIQIKVWQIIQNAHQMQRPTRKECVFFPDQYLIPHSELPLITRPLDVRYRQDMNEVESMFQALLYLQICRYNLP